MKKNKVISLVIILVMIVSLSGYGYAVNQDGPVRAADGEFNETFSGSPALTQEDVNNHYQNYASKEGTYYFSSGKNKNEETLNHVGAVMDMGTDEPIPGAVIEIDSEKTIVTDQRGRFQIPDYPVGKHDCVIHAEGYFDSYYLNMESYIAGSTIISFFYVSKKMEFVEDHDELKRQIQEREASGSTKRFSASN